MGRLQAARAERRGSIERRRMPLPTGASARASRKTSRLRKITRAGASIAKNTTSASATELRDFTIRKAAGGQSLRLFIYDGIYLLTRAPAPATSMFGR